MSFLTTEDGVRLRYADRGQGDPPFVLVHGWKGSHRIWDHTITRLARSHRVVAFDLRGMGESDKPSSRYDFDELSDDLAFVMRELGLERVTLVGWSMGCSVSLRHMERGGEHVGRLVLSNGPLRLTRTEEFPHTMTEVEFEAYVADLERGWPQSEREFQAGGLREPDAPMTDWLYQIALQTPLDIALRVVREQAKLDMRPILERIEVPVLALYARHDPYYPPGLPEYIAERCPRGEHVILDEGAHYVQLECPARFAAELRRFAEAEPDST